MCIYNALDLEYTLRRQKLICMKLQKHERLGQPEQVDGLHRKTQSLLPCMVFQHYNSSKEPA